MPSEFTSRYEALGMALPDPATMCKGECEGTGWMPVKADDEQYGADWAAAEAKQPSDDEYHFVKCHDCGGTGLRNADVTRGYADSVYGFAAWLTTRATRSGPFSAHDDSAPMAELVKQFCSANRLETSPEYPNTFVMPKEK